MEGQGTEQFGSLHAQYLWENSIQVINVNKKLEIGQG
jgi:hypothetical protein